MKVLLVNPHDASQQGFSNPPLGLAYLAATLRSAGIEVEIVDGYISGEEGIRRKVESYSPNVVGITCYTPGRKNVIEIARRIKNFDPNIRIILGGAHPTIMWMQILENHQFIDICVIGEGEQTLLEIVKGKPLSDIEGIAYRQEGVVRRNSNRKTIENLNSIPFPAWDLIEINKYPQRLDAFEMISNRDIKAIPYLPVIFSRGCIGNCSFCSTWWIWQGYRNRSPENMVDELAYLNRHFGIEHFVFEDDVFSANIEEAKALCNEIMGRKLNIAWFATTRVDCIDEELLRKMKEAGCYMITYGIESGSQQILDLMRKKTTVKQGEEALLLTKKIGIKVGALIIAGNYGETNETINETVAFLKKTNPDQTGTLGSLWVFPGTKLYTDLKRQGTINDEYWLSDAPKYIYKENGSYFRAITYKAKLGSFEYGKLYGKELLLRFFKKPIRNTEKLIALAIKRLFSVSRLEKNS